MQSHFFKNIELKIANVRSDPRIYTHTCEIICCKKALLLVRLILNDFYGQKCISDTSAQLIPYSLILSIPLLLLKCDLWVLFHNTVGGLLKLSDTCHGVESTVCPFEMQ